MSVAETQQPIFEFTANNMCLDFCNTLHDRASGPLELLTSYDKLLLWGQQAHILTEDEAHLLNKEAQHHKEEAAAVLQQAIDLREAIFRLLLAKLQGSSPDEADLGIFNASFSHTMAQSCIVPHEHGFERNWLSEEHALDRPLWPVVRSAADLLTTEELEDVRICASDTCSWLFLDTSKNHTRRC